MNEDNTHSEEDPIVSAAPEKKGRTFQQNQKDWPLSRSADRKSVVSYPLFTNQRRSSPVGRRIHEYK